MENIYKKLRIEAKLTQSELAKNLGISSGKISKLENNAVTPDGQLALKYANYFNVDRSDLIEDNENTMSIPLFIEDNFPRDRLGYGFIIETFILFKGEKKPLHLNTITNINTIRNAFESDSFLMIYTCQGMCLLINMEEVEMITFHEDGANEYPEIFKNGFYEYKAGDKRLEKEEFLWLLARKSGYDDSLSGYDFNYFVKHCIGFPAMAHTAINSFKQKNTENYSALIEPSNFNNLSDHLDDIWGCDILFKDNTSIFIPGVNTGLDTEENIIFMVWLAAINPDSLASKLSFSDSEERDNTYCILSKNIRYISLPYILLALYKNIEEDNYSLENYGVVRDQLFSSTDSLGSDNIHFL